MPSLRELQRRFSAAVMFDDPAAIASIGIVAGDLSPAQRVSVYRNNILGNYRQALGITYPVVRQLVGAAFFDAAADIFSRGHASAHGDVNRYGGDYATFLATYPPARNLVYLPDVARLEWAVDQANIAADAGPMDTSALARVDADAFAGLRFVLHPSVRLLASTYPILHIWRSNQTEANSEHVDLDEGGDHLLVRRSGVVAHIARIDRGDYALLDSLAANATLGAAAERASLADASFALVDALRRYVAENTIVDFRATVTAPRENHR
jgi:hypothetical protein